MKKLSLPLLLFTLFSPSFARDSLTSTTSLLDGQTLVSTGGIFELGFFSPGNSPYRYLGIWYKKIPVQTIVWIANRASPLTDSTGVLTIRKDGNLVLLNSRAEVLWTTGSRVSASSNPIAQLLDSGNFVLTAEESSSPESFAWQSFDYPSDTLLPGMKLGWNLKTGLNRYISSWKSSDDPSPGSYSFRMDPHGSPELFLYRESTKIHASGPWNGLQFSGIPELKPDDFFRFSFISNKDEVYYTYEINKGSVVSRLAVTTSGLVQRFVWLDATRAWNVFWSDPKDQCDHYAACGPFGVCNSNQSPVCSCLEGFRPKSPQEWNLRDGSAGCVRITPSDCKGDGFVTLSNMKLPDTTSASVDESMSLNMCRESCLKNCSCRAYASANIGGGESGCIIWATDLIDIRHFVGGGQNLQVRLAASELAKMNSGRSSDDKKVVIVSVLIFSGLLLLGIGGCCMLNEKRRTTSSPSFSGRGPAAYLAKEHCSDDEIRASKELDLPFFDLEIILAATNSFAIESKVGEGGFGPVYQGKLNNGQDIAVKRLSEKSSQGPDEFKNEVMLIAKLQHRNLVRLLGCCIHRGERMLIYEYMHNGSLDTFIFDEGKRSLLSWQNRFVIILGIARGLLYLHQDSRFRIIHRDLKAGNVLLDREMNPKISDFGMARIFGDDQTHARTRKVVGTYGYMAPEYAMDGILSIKLDVFSFGVLVLEIISGKRNRGFYQSEQHSNLITHAWKLWKEGKSFELLDESLEDLHTSEVLRCIQVGLLCAQAQPGDRPMMSSVIMMLATENAALPEPKEPGFSTGEGSVDIKTCIHSANYLTATSVQAR
ncbi:receptor-like serine/threonine-protein kinase SD1-8 [Elaeis guineensis]|uniref:Receptor-like serine/threonine-protein kinase n=1 Tax=Elaeis guineensis var. tenera TaxID=51953 RepID=A0A8N4IEF0_ELAGV|nr:receptor-like serine/threonine-protein kinase SD1-8 [Elaeis guineensis]